MQQEHLRAVNAEPIPGYRLIEPLGRGGFGEVWKCEAPGGLFKAIKFVADDHTGLTDELAPAAEELKALQQVKALRHPFLLSIERIEVIDGELVIVMELADKNLLDLLQERQAAGQTGIARAELLGYLREAADVLDLMNLRHGLQHLDIKPANLFLVSDHVKVADFGLVRSLADHGGDGAQLSLGALTALYAAPELFQSTISSSCDQYSLAIVYQHLLTGTVPFNGKNARQMALLHSTAEPALQALPEADRAVVGRALAKDPAQRFPSCTAFIQALLDNGRPEGAGRADAAKNDTRTDLAMVTTRRTAAVREGGPAERQPAQASYLPDYQLQALVARSALEETWEAKAPDGQRVLIKFLFGTGESAREQKALARLQALRHPALPELRVLPAGPGCVVLVSQAGEATLRDRFREHRQQGDRGIPRQQLLSWLRGAAEALDELAGREDLQHLGLNPRCLVFHGEQLRLADFGLLPLLRYPAGQLAGQLQARYAAPELLAQRPGPACDPYSLAIIYQEMLTGTTPWRGRRSGPPNLDTLPEGDRAILARALADDPGQRFTTCTELIQALQDVSGQDGAAGAEAADAGPGAVLAELIVEAKRGLAQQSGEWEKVGDTVASLQERFPARRLPRPTAEDFEPFIRQWNAEVTRSTAGSVTFQVPLRRGFWDRWLGGARPALVVEVRWRRPRADAQTLPEVRVIIRPAQKKADDKVLQEVGPLLLESLHAHLDAAPERRKHERVAWPYPVRVSFVPADGQPEEIVEGRGKDISLGGMGLYLPRIPATSQITLHLTTPTRTEPVVLSGSCLRFQRCPDGWFEASVRF